MPVDPIAKSSGAMNPVTIIPSRLASTRLPGKPLADIAGKPMIVQVADRALEAGCGPVVVACDDPSITAAVVAAGHHAVMTSLDHQSGSDRIAEALSIIDPQGAFDVVINVQGDLPTLDPALVRTALSLLDDPACDIATLCTPITDPAEADNPNVVKLVGAPLRTGQVDAKVLRALYFTRATAPWGEGPLWHHIGLYVYRREALIRFVAAPPSVLEQRERLEQLRALEDRMEIHAAIVDTVPLGVDTPPDLERARAILART